MTTALAKTNGEKALQNPEFVEQLKTSNVLGLTVSREIQFAVQLLKSNTYLQKCTPESLQDAVINSALNGLTLNPTLAQAYLIPRRKGNEVIACLDPGFQGIISKMIGCGAVTDVYAHVVFTWEVENGKFTLEFGTNKGITHHPYYMFGVSEADRGEPIGVYAVGVLPDGSKKPEFLPAERIHSIMKRSESYKVSKKNKTKSSIWEGEDRFEMWKKTAIKYLWKYLPKNDTEETRRVGNLVAMSNTAHEVSDIEYTTSGTAVDTHGTDKAAKRNKNAKDKVQDVPQKRSTEVVEVEAEEVLPTDERLKELETMLTEDYPIAEGKTMRNTNSFNQVKKAVAKIGFDHATVDAYLEGDDNYTTSRDLYLKGSTEDIVDRLGGILNAETK